MKKICWEKDLFNLSFWIYQKLKLKRSFSQRIFLHFNFFIKVLRDFYTFCTSGPKEQMHTSSAVRPRTEQDTYLIGAMPAT